MSIPMEDRRPVPQTEQSVASAELSNSTERHDVNAPLSTSVADGRNVRLRAYPPGAFKGPLLESRDIAAVALGSVMMLAPLAALPLGFG